MSTSDRSQKYDETRVLSNLGGISGMYLGLSFFILFQVLDILVIGALQLKKTPPAGTRASAAWSCTQGPAHKKASKPSRRSDRRSTAESVASAMRSVAALPQLRPCQKKF
ncbi:hypothetical protein MRX96_034498 [Rhipicephalus microplus]